MKKFSGRTDVVRKAGFKGKNVVAHIYIDAYEYFPLSFNPPYLTKNRVVGDFVGFIVEIIPKERYKIIFYNEVIRVKKDWSNIYGKFLPSMKRHKTKPTWLTIEGDYVQYIHLKKLIHQKTSIGYLSFMEFLKITSQIKEDFICNESIKYSGC